LHCNECRSKNSLLVIGNKYELAVRITFQWTKVRSAANQEKAKECWDQGSHRASSKCSLTTSKENLGLLVMAVTKNSELAPSSGRFGSSPAAHSTPGRTAGIGHKQKFSMPANSD